MTQVDIISGFLGAGKTTLMSRYADYLRRTGTAFTIIENEYGATGIDTKLLANASEKVLELAGGCICCTLQPKFLGMLREEAPRQQRILVEPSGVFQPDDIMGLIPRGDSEAGFRLGMCLTVVDPLSIGSMSGALRQDLMGLIGNTGHILWSKTDLADEETMQMAREQLDSLLPEGELDRLHYPVPSWQLRDEDFAFLQQNSAPTRQVLPGVSVGHPEEIEAYSLPVGRAFSEAEIEALVRKIEREGGEEEGAQLMRMKGVVRGEGKNLLVNYVLGGQISIEASPLEETTRLNIIGHGLDMPRIFEWIEPA